MSDSYNTPLLRSLIIRPIAAQVAQLKRKGDS
jgi:hypothetical protein